MISLCNRPIHRSHTGTNILILFRVLYRGGDPGISPLTSSPPLKFDNCMYTKHQYNYVIGSEKKTIIAHGCIIE